MNNTEQIELKVVAPDSEEAKELLKRDEIIYGSDGTPYMNVDRILDGGIPDVNDKEKLKLVKEQLPKLFPALVEFHEHHEKWYCAQGYREALTEILYKYEEDEFKELDTDLLAFLWEYLDSKHGKSTRPLSGLEYAQAVMSAITEVTTQFGGMVHCEYTYNDSDSYTGNHDVQITWLAEGEVIHGGCYLAYVQVHRGGDARCVPDGYWHNPEDWSGHGCGSGAIEDLLYSSPCIGIEVEIPLGFPVEEYLKVKDARWPRSLAGDDTQFYPETASALKAMGYDDTRKTYRLYLYPESYNGDSCDMFQLCEKFNSYKGDWKFHPKGEVIGELVPSIGVSATPHIPTELTWATDGYMEYIGPKFGTEEFLAWLEELELEPEVIVIEADGQSHINFGKDENDE